MQFKIGFMKTLIPAIALLVLIQGCAVIESGSVGVKTSLGTVKNESLQPGIHVSVPGIDWVTVYSARTVSMPEEFGSLTSDGQSMKVTATALYSINQTKAPQIFSTIGNTDEAVKDKIVHPVLLEYRGITGGASCTAIPSPAIVTAELPPQKGTICLLAVQERCE